MEKLDLTKKHKTYFTARTKPELMIIERANFLSIAGKGDPSDKKFSENIQALYSVTYAVKFSYKALEKDFVVSKLEGLWWFDEKKFGNNTMVDVSTNVPRTEWEYKLLIRIPDFVTQREIDLATKKVVEKKGLPLANKVEFFEMRESKSVQILHVGPFSNEPETLQKLDIFMKENNLAKNGFHHEIYLSDFRKTHPSKFRTILREPVK
jgi:hypothetical protein